jgi:competence protein ComEC
MVEWGRGDGRGRAETWPSGGGAGGRRRALRWRIAVADRADAIVRHIRTWAAAEAEPGRLLPWLPIAFGFGIVLYFSAEREPSWWAAIAVALSLACTALLGRHRPIAFPLALAMTAAAAGFAVATLKSVHLAHPVLSHPAGNVAVEGFVEVREERERSDRIVVRALRLESAARLEQRPDRLRISVRKGLAPPVGAYVRFRARLNPPLAPLRPGGYDFARDLYFQGIGAVGFVLGPIRTLEPPVPRGFWLEQAARLQALRDAIDARIRAVVPGDKGAIASALITGKRDAISASVSEAMYISSLAHVLSISGYHMAVVAGAVFFIVRALLALAPALAARRPIKKWAALVALAAAAFYLVLSGAEVATQRAFIMTAIVLVGVMADRPALTLRTLAMAAFGVLLVAPQAVVHPSFQMSFAATLALVAAYERAMRFDGHADSNLGARIALWGGRQVASLVLASLVAGLATTPFAAFHFHRLAPYGVLANLAAMPIVSAWVMPTGLVALAVIPLGFDGPLWRLMGEGIGWMIAVATWVASLPGAVGRIPAFGIGPLALASAGLVLVCLLRTPLRWCGAGLIIAASLWALRTPLPDVLIAADGQTLAVRGAAGALAIHRAGRDAFSVRDWLAADGDARTASDPALAAGFACDPSGCIGRLRDNLLVAHAFAPEAFREDCERAAIVVTPREAPPDCAARVIDRAFLRTHGAIALRREGNDWRLDAARPPGEERPWARQRLRSVDSAAGVARPSLRDATPPLEALEAGD